MGILDAFLPNTMRELDEAKLREMQLAKLRGQAAQGIEGQFEVEGSQIPGYSKFMAEQAAKAGDLPLSMFQKQPPEVNRLFGGQTFDPNRQPEQIVEPPENMPIEYVNPRSLEDRSIMESERKGRSDMAGKFAGTKYGYEQREDLAGIFPDYKDEISNMNIPGSAGFEAFDLPKPGESEPVYGGRVWNPKVGAYVQSAEGQPDKWSPKPNVGPGGPDDKMPPEVVKALGYFQAMAKQQGLDSTKAILLAFKPQLADKLKSGMDPQAQKVYDLMASIVQKHFSAYAGQTGANDPMGIR